MRELHYCKECDGHRCYLLSYGCDDEGYDPHVCPRGNLAHFEAHREYPADVFFKELGRGLEEWDALNLDVDEEQELAPYWNAVYEAWDHYGDMDAAKSALWKYLYPEPGEHSPYSAQDAFLKATKTMTKYNLARSFARMGMVYGAGMILQYLKQTGKIKTC